MKPAAPYEQHQKQGDKRGGGRRSFGYSFRTPPYSAEHSFLSAARWALRVAELRLSAGEFYDGTAVRPRAKMFVHCILAPAAAGIQ